MDGERWEEERRSLVDMVYNETGVDVNSTKCGRNLCICNYVIATSFWFGFRFYDNEYDSPWTFLGRRNEVWVVESDSDVEGDSFCMDGEDGD